MDKLIAFDLETYMIKEGEPPPPICISWASTDPRVDKGVVGTVTSKCPLTGRPGDGILSVSKYILNLALEEGHHIIAQNIKFDLGVLFYSYPELRPAIFEVLDRGLFHDTYIRHKLYHISTIGSCNMVGAYNLAGLAKYYLGVDISKDKEGADAPRCNYAKYDKIPVEFWDKEYVRYALMDSVYTLEVYQEQEKVRQDAGVGSMNTEDLQIGYDFCLNLVTTEGLEIDMGKAVKLEEELDFKINPIRRELIAFGVAEDKQKDVPGLLHKISRCEDKITNLRTRIDKLNEAIDEIS